MSLFNFTKDTIYIVTTNYTIIFAETLRKYLYKHFPNIKCNIYRNITENIASKLIEIDKFIIFIGTIHIINSKYITLLPAKKYYIIQIEQLNQNLYYYHKIDYNLCKFIKNSIITYDYSFINFNHYPHEIKNYIRFINLYKIYNEVYSNNISFKRILYASNYSKDGIVFVGTLNDRRKNIINYLNNNLNVKITTLTAEFGNKLIEILKNYKIVINLHYYSNAILEIFRILDLTWLSDCYIISEKPDNKQEDYLIDKYSKHVEFIDTIHPNLLNITNLIYKITNIMFL